MCDEPCRPRKWGTIDKRGTDPLSKIAGLGAARSAFEATRYFPPILVGDRRADVTLGPAGGDEQVDHPLLVQPSFPGGTGIVQTERWLPERP